MPANPESGLVIVGQGPAGTAAAKAFRALNPTAPVILLTQEKYACYSRPRLPEVVSGQAESRQICIYPEGWYAEQSIRLLLDRRVTAINTRSQQVLTEDGQSFHYDKLLLATGAQPALPPIAGLPTPQAMGRVAGGNAAGAAAKYPGLVEATKLKVAGVDLWSQGEIRPEGATVLARSDPRAGWLTKLFVRRERIVGFIQIGRTYNTSQLRRLLERKIVISGFEDRMLEENFDFSGIPGFSG